MMIEYRTFVSGVSRDAVTQMVSEALVNAQVRTMESVEQNVKFGSEIEVGDRSLWEFIPLAPSMHLVLRSEMVREILHNITIFALTMEREKGEVLEAWIWSPSGKFDLTEEDVAQFLPIGG